MANWEVINFKTWETPSGDEMGRLLFPNVKEKKDRTTKKITTKVSDNTDTPKVLEEMKMKIIIPAPDLKIPPITPWIVSGEVDGWSNTSISKDGGTAVVGWITIDGVIQ